MWKSGIMQGWQEDKETLDHFVEREMPDFESFIADSAGLPGEDREEILGSFAAKLDGLIAVHKKWAGYRTLQKKMDESAAKISALRRDLNLCAEGKPVRKLLPSPEKDPVSILMKYYRGKGVVGEEELCILQTLCASSSIHFGIEGPSGSGKTFAVEALLNLLPRNSVFKIGVCSDTAVYYQAESINDCKFIYIPELQKAMRNMHTTVEFIKDISEGRSSTRHVNVGKQTKEYTIDAGKTVIYTLADENGYAKDMETARRVVALRTNTSEEHVKGILRGKTCSRFEDEKQTINEAEMAFLKMHMAKLISSDKPSTKDPFAEYMAQYMPALPVSASFVEHYYLMLDAYARFNSSKRVRKGDILFLNIEDHYMVDQLYRATFCKNLEDMAKGYFREHDEIVAKAKEASETKIDWAGCWSHGLVKMRNAFPGIADEWEAAQKESSTVCIYNPLNSERIEILGEEKPKSPIADLACLGMIGALYLSSMFPL